MPLVSIFCSKKYREILFFMLIIGKKTWVFHAVKTTQVADK